MMVIKMNPFIPWRFTGLVLAAVAGVAAWQAAACSGPAVRGAAAPRKAAAPRPGEGYLLDLRSGEVLALTQGKHPLVLGRQGDLRVRGSSLVSRRHLAIQRRGGEMHVTDTRSTNGTALNAAPLKSGAPRPLKQGDVLALAAARAYQFHERRPPATKIPPRAWGLLIDERGLVGYLEAGDYDLVIDAQRLALKPSGEPAALATLRFSKRCAEVRDRRDRTALRYAVKRGGLFRWAEASPQGWEEVIGTPMELRPASPGAAVRFQVILICEAGDSASCCKPRSARSDSGVPRARGADAGAPGPASITGRAATPAEQRYNACLAALKSTKYVASRSCFEALRKAFPFSRFATLAELRVADSYLAQRAYPEAGDGYSLFRRFHPTSSATTGGYACYKLCQAYTEGLITAVKPPVTEREVRFYRRLAQKAFHHFFKHHAKSEHLEAVKALRKKLPSR